MGCEFKCFKGECDKCCTTPQMQIPVTLMRDTGRNDPCPCGSRKKFKKCCGGH